MVLEKPGKKYYPNGTDWPKRFEKGDFPKGSNIDISKCVPAPDGWHLAMVMITYLKGDRLYVNIRYIAGDSVDVGLGWEGDTLDMEWVEEQGWKVETAWDDGVSDLHELEWEVRSEGEPFTSTVETAFEYMREHGEFISQFTQNTSETIQT